MTKTVTQSAKLIARCDEGGLHFRGSAFGDLECERCVLSLRPSPRSVFEGCTFGSISAHECTIWFPAFRSCVFRDVRADFLACYGASFVECVFEGVLNGINFGFTPHALATTRDVASQIYAENRKMDESGAFAIDVRSALLANVAFDGEDIVPRVIFRPGQCLIYRSSGLHAKLRQLIESVPDQGLRMGLLPPVDPKQSVHLVTLDAGGAGERVPELRRLVEQLGVEVLEEPLCELPA